MDPYFLNAWVALFQAGLSLLVCPIAFKMQSPELSLEDMPRNFHDGFMCFFAGMKGHALYLRAVKSLLPA
jgi:hypothetical protein